MTIAQLQHQHEQLSALNDRLDAFVRQPSADRRALAQIRLEMSSLLREHLNLEEQLIYAPLRRHADVAEELRRSDEDLIARRVAYSTHVNHWTLERVVSDWRDYRRDVTVLTRGLTTRIAYERDVIYPLFHRLCPGTPLN